MLVSREKALISYKVATSAAPLFMTIIHVKSSSKDSFCQPAALLSLWEVTSPALWLPGPPDEI